MKSQSFESQLRQAVPPAPDLQAKSRARRVAIEEFERLHARQSAPTVPAIPAVPVVPARSGRSSWTSRNTLLGGFASACVVVVGASVIWLLPPDQREIKLHRALPAEPTPLAPVDESGTLVPGNQLAPLPPAGDQVQPEKEPPRSQSNSAQRRTERKDSPSQISPTAPEPASDSAPAPAASDPAPEPASVPAPGPNPTTITDVTDRPVPRAPASSPPQADPKTEFEDVVVTGSRIQRQNVDSPSPVTTIGGTAPSGNAASGATAEGELMESVVTASRSAGRRTRGPRELSASNSSSEARSERQARRQEAKKSTAQSVQGGDRFAHFEINPVKRVATDPVSTFSVDVDTTSYSFVRRQLNQGTLPPVDSVRVEEMINYFDYAWPTPESRDQPFKPTVTVSNSPWNEGKKLIHVGIKGYALPVEQQPDVNLVLLLDVSGSMDSPDKLPLAQQSMALLLDSLKPTDTVGIVVYAGAAGMVLPPTPVRQKDTILVALNSLRPGGSTAGAAGIKLAYELAERNFRKNGVNRILLATDGDFNVGISDENELKGFVQRERGKGVFLSVLGFGVGNYHDETAQVLAQNGNGTAAYIDSLNEAKKVLVQQSTGSLFTIAKDVKLQVEFNPATVSEYRLIGYETRSLNTQDFNNDKVDAGDVGAGHTVTAIYEITPVGSGAELIGERRYAARDEEKTSPARSGKANEYGFLKIRYKLPNGFRSRLLEQPILVDTDVPAALRKDVAFSTAVAGFGQLLRGGAYTGSIGYDEVMRQAEDGIGDDAHGYRREFVEMVRRVAREKEER